jgi:hypothetical protein
MASVRVLCPDAFHVVKRSRITSLVDQVLSSQAEFETDFFLK